MRELSTITINNNPIPPFPSIPCYAPVSYRQIFHEINHPAVGVPPWLWKPLVLRRHILRHMHNLEKQSLEGKPVHKPCLDGHIYINRCILLYSVYIYSVYIVCIYIVYIYIYIVYICICISVYIYVYIYTCIIYYVYIYIYTCIHMGCIEQT